MELSDKVMELRIAGKTVHSRFSVDSEGERYVDISDIFEAYVRACSKDELDVLVHRIRNLSVVGAEMSEIKSKFLLAASGVKGSNSFSGSKILEVVVPEDRDITEATMNLLFERYFGLVG